MRSLVALASTCLALGLARPALAGPEPEPESQPPPTNPGTALLVWGGLGVTLGTTGVVGGAALCWWLGSPIGAIPIAFGGSALVLGGVGLHFGIKRRRALRAWEAKAGMDLHAWRRLHEADRPLRSGVGMISAGASSVVVGAVLTGIGFAARWQPLATYEPGDAPGALAMSVTGTIMLVAGTTTLAMGSIQRRRYLDWQRRRVAVELGAYPWATVSSVGWSLAGRF